jgi:hypothetical protein
MMSTKYKQARDAVSALNRFLKRGAQVRRGERKRHFENDRETARSLSTDPNILGFGVGPKLSGNDRKPDEICLVIFVRRKMPKSRLRHMVEIPKHLFLDTLGLKIRTDVQVWGHPPVAHSVSAGDSVGDLAGNSGTMTLCVIDKSQGGEGDPLILGCSHVLANAGLGHVDDPVDSPAAPAFDPGRNTVARLRRFSIINEKSTSNQVDAAVAVPRDGVDLSNNIAGIGTPAGILDLRPQGHTVINQVEVQRPGLSTGIQSGLIRNIHVSTSITYHQLPGDPSVRFVELVQYDVSSEEGDSGAPVMDTSEQHNVVGMHIAGMASDSISLFTHIQAVFDKMELQFPG